MAIVQHSLGYGERKVAGGRSKFHASCSCGWHKPVRAKLTHVMSDLRDHSGQVVREAMSSGYRIRRGEGLSVTVEIPDTPDSEDLPRNVGEVV